MVIDDHDVIREAVKRALGHAPDITVVGDAPDGAAALTVVNETRPNVVVMDMKMPVMDGLEATLAIKAQHPHVAIVSFSSEDVETMTRACDATVEKGRMKELIDEIRRLAQR